MNTGLRKKFRGFRDWCPQPQKQVLANFKALSMPLLASILIAEVLILLVAPMAYCALLLPKEPSFNQVLGKELPLNNSQIRTAWPNLPTAQEVAGSNSSFKLIITNSMETFNQVKNYTIISCLADTGAAGYPVLPPPLVAAYSIWLQLNSTAWIFVGDQYLATSNPPYSPPYSQYFRAQPPGFLGTGLPTTYVAAAIAVIIVTSFAGTSYVLHKKG